jgi:hypothetical protein
LAVACFYSKYYNSIYCKRDISEDILKSIFDLAGGITGDVQQFCEALWSTTDAGSTIGQEQVNAAIKLLISRENLSFQIILARLTDLQVRVLRALAELGGKKPTSKTFLEKIESRNASEVAQTLDRLAKMKIIYRSQNEWKYMNPVLKIYLLRLM